MVAVLLSIKTAKKGFGSYEYNNYNLSTKVCLGTEEVLNCKSLIHAEEYANVRSEPSAALSNFSKKTN